MNENYVRGFMDKCAEAGVDPEELVKLSGGLQKAWQGVQKGYTGVKGLVNDARTSFNDVVHPTPSHKATRASRKPDTAILGKNITPGGHLRGAGYSERLGLPSIESVVDR